MNDKRGANQPDPGSQSEIDKALANVLEAGFGEVLIKVADGVIVNIKYEATRSIFKSEREKQPNK